MREKVIELIRKFIETNTRIFFNENEFQMYLAIFLRDNGYNVYVEYKVAMLHKDTQLNDKPHSIYLDIVVEKDGRYMPIELKYKTTGKNNFSTGVDTFGNGEAKTLETQGAHNNGCYDFWRDVERVESMVREYENVELGVAVILTNDQQYWTLPHDGRSVNCDYSDFSLKDERKVAASSSLNWQTQRKAPMHRINVIDIKHEHIVKWAPTGQQHIMSDKIIEEFKYLILPK